MPTKADAGIAAEAIDDLRPDYTTAAHDESDGGQQELYVALSGAGAVVTGGRGCRLDPESLRVLCIGGVPGARHVAPEWTV